jgi:hypothetical protein
VAKRKKRKPVSRLKPETREADDELRDSLRHADLKLFDKVLGKAIRPVRT